MELIKTAGILEGLLSSKYRPEELNPNKSILAVNKKLKEMAKLAEEQSYSNLKSEVRSEKRVVSKNPGQIVLEPVHNTSNAFFQSWRVSDSDPTMKDFSSELNTFKDNNNHVIVKGDNSIVENSNQQSSKQISNLEKRFPCSFCDEDYSSIGSLKRHYLKNHLEMHGSYDMHREKFLKAAFLKDVSSEMIPKNVSSPITPIKPLRINLSKRLVTQAHLDDLRNQKSDSVDKPEDTVPKEVEEKIMEYVNRRHVQCKECSKRFRTTKLVQLHVANQHLKFKRFLCCFCDFGSWSRDHVIKHAAASHRKSSKDVVQEQDVKDYFIMPVATPSSSKKKLLCKSPGWTSPLKRMAEVRLSPVKLLHDNLINLDKKEKSPSNCSEQDSDTELLPSSVLTGLKDQIRKSIEDDQKPLMPMNGEIPVPVKTPSTRPKRKRETSGSSCTSSTQDGNSMKGLKSSPTLILDTRATSARLKSPTKTNGEFCVKSKQKNCTKVRTKCAPAQLAQPAKSGDSKKVKRSLSK